MSSPEINYKIGNESLIEVLPNASERLLGLLEKQGKADFGALRVAVVGGGVPAFNTRWILSMVQSTEILWLLRMRLG